MDQQRQKIVSLCYVIAGAGIGYLFHFFVIKLSAFYDLEARIPNFDIALQITSIVLGALVFFILFKNDKVNQYMHEAVAELGRVSWPTPQESWKATIVVIVMVLISAAILGSLDSLWAWLLKQVL